MSSLIKSQVSKLLTQLNKNSEVTLLVEGKEKNELINSAVKRGILIKGSKDLGILKTTYLFCDVANENSDLVPSKEFKKILPQIIGKQMNYNHQREVILGYYIDYKYILKENKVIAYAVFFKSNYPDLWEKAKKLQKQGKLSSSFEIWSAEKNRKYTKNGICELHNMEIAGGALVYEENGVLPAYRNAKVLSMARKNIEQCVDGKCLALASKYKKEDIITADIYLDEIEKNLQKLKKEEENKKVVELTKKVEPKVEEKVEAPKVEVTEPKEVIEEKKAENITPKEPEIIDNSEITCSNCQEILDLNITPEISQGMVKCPKCFAILNGQTGEIIYPPQIKDFRMSCPACRMNNWLILSNEESKTKLKCLNEICNKTFEVEFKIQEKNELLDKMKFVYIKSVSCLQCGNSIDISTTSHAKNIEITCKRCGLVFLHDITKGNKDRQITKITEIIEDESSEKGGEDEVKKPDEKVEEKVEEKPKEEVTPKADEKIETPKEEIKGILEKQVEKVEENKAKKPAAKASIEIPENSEVVKSLVDIIKKENKDLETAKRGKGKGKNGKPQGDGGADKCVCSKCGYSVSHEKGKPCNEKKCPKCGTALIGKNKEAKKKIKPKKSAIRKAVRKIMDLKKEKIEKENTLKTAIKKVASQLIKAYAEIKKIKLEADEKIELYKSNAKTILKRQGELGEKFVGDLSDKDILDDDKFKTASLEKEVTLLKASKEGSDEIVGDKTDEDENSEDIKLANEIDAKAFTKKKKE